MSAKRSGLFIVVAIGHALAFAGSSTAQPYPERPVRFIVPFPAGGSTDVAARLIGDHLSRSWGRQVFVENRTGASGVIGVEAAAKSAPDGYTILVATDSVASTPHVYKMSINPVKDLIPVVQVSRQPVVLAAHPSLGVASLAELIALARQQPGLRYANGSGAGSPQHIAMQWWAHLAGIKVEQVPYRGGAPAINDLIAGHVKIAGMGSSPLIPYYKSGALRLLAQTMEVRSTSLPDVPTFREAGFNELALAQWIGVFAPAGTPPAIVARLNADINKALADPTIRERFEQVAQDPVGGGDAPFAQFMREEYEKYGRLVKELNITTN